MPSHVVGKVDVDAFLNEVHMSVPVDGFILGAGLSSKVKFTSFPGQRDPGPKDLP
jgi:hypothetical protein